MKRLFEVKQGGKSLYPPQYFDTKHGAKIFKSGEAGRKTLHVSIGPDHWKYGLKAREGRSHSHNMRSGGSGNGFKVVKRRRVVS